MSELISDEFILSMLASIKPYTIVLLEDAAGKQKENAQAVIWEHGRRNFALRKEGILNIVIPIANSNGLAGIAVFNAEEARVKEIMEEDPAVQAGIFTYRIYNGLSFPGDSLK